MILVFAHEPRLNHAERHELAEPLNDLRLGVRRQQRTKTIGPADLLENAPELERQARVLVLQRCPACLSTSKGARARWHVLVHKSGLIRTRMLRQANRIEKGFDSSIKQFYAALHRYLSIGPGDAVDGARMSGMA